MAEGVKPSVGGIVTTSITSTMLGGAIATVVSFYLRTKHGIDFPEEVGGAVQTIFTTLVMVFGVVAHLLLRRLFPKELQ